MSDTMVWLVQLLQIQVEDTWDDKDSSSWTRMDPALARGYCLSYKERHNGVTGAATARDLQIQVEDTWDDKDSSSWEGTAYIPVERG